MNALTRAARADNWTELARLHARSEHLTSEQRAEELLTNLRDFIHKLSQTPQGRADLQRREMRLGACRPEAGECPRNFYGRLRRWLDVEFTDDAPAHSRR